MHRDSILGTLVIVLLAVVVCGASAPNGVPPGQEASVTGCLKAGEKEGEFVLVIDEKESHQVLAAEGVELAPHLNHRVEITGTIEKSESSSVLKATALKMIAKTCEG